jgi:ERCC4-related helicase
LEKEAKILGKDLNVQLCCGGRSITPIIGRRVLVATPQTIVNALRDGIISFERMSLLILDECHHTRKNHPYAVIMNQYLKAPSRPKVIGLTASPGENLIEIRSLCERLCCKIATVKSEEYEEFCHIPDVKIRMVDPTRGANNFVIKLGEEIRNLLDKLDIKVTNEEGDLLHPCVVLLLNHRII